jgi:hypothetical protein
VTYKRHGGPVLFSMLLIVLFWASQFYTWTYSPCWLSLPWWLLGLLSSHTVHQDVGEFIPEYTAAHPRNEGGGGW